MYDGDGHGYPERYDYIQPRAATYYRRIHAAGHRCAPRWTLLDRLPYIPKGMFHPIVVPLSDAVHQIFNVAKGRGLDEAVRYLDSTPKLTSVGEQEAITHWNALHSHPQNTPEYMAFYDAELQNEFDDLYESLLNEYELSLDIDWDHDETRNRVRTVFETLGKRLQTRQPEWCCRVGVSMRLYARLPVACTDDSSQGPQFCSTSALPAKRWLERLASERHHFNFDGETLGIVSADKCLSAHLPDDSTCTARAAARQIPSHLDYRREDRWHIRQRA